MKDDQIVAQETERLDRLEHRIWIVVEVGHERENAASLEVLGQVAQHMQVAGSSGRCAIQRVQHDVEMLGRRRDVLDDRAVEGHDPDPIALAMGQIRQTGRQKARVLELRDAAACESHRSRHVEQHAEVRIRVRFVLFNVVAIRPRV